MGRLLRGQVQTWLDNFDLSDSDTCPATAAGATPLPEISRKKCCRPYTDEQVKESDEAVSHALSSTSILGCAVVATASSTASSTSRTSTIPFVCDFAKLVYNPLKGIPALMSRETQLQDIGFQLSPDATSRPTLWSSCRRNIPAARLLSERGRRLHARTAPTRPTTGSCSSTPRC